MEFVSMESKMTREKCEKLVLECVKKVRDLKDFEFTMQTSFYDPHVGDSLDRVEIVMECEECFNMLFPEEDFDKVKTLGDIADYAFAHQQTGCFRHSSPNGK